MSTLSLIIHDAPQGKGRARADFAHRRTYTPARTAAWEGRAATEIAAQLPDGWKPLTGPVSLAMTAVFPRPASMECRHKRACRCAADGLLERRPHVSAPDTDNVVKAICDALTRAGVLHDDRIVWSVQARKWVAAAGEAPRVVLTVAWDGDDLLP